MTKIKNTKKGMAKKTLSMSLVVAMLATSNVPVWAAEFSDGTDATAVTSEAEAFSADEADVPTIEENIADAATADTTDAELAVLVGNKTVSNGDVISQSDLGKLSVILTNKATFSESTVYTGNPTKANETVTCVRISAQYGSTNAISETALYKDSAEIDTSTFASAAVGDKIVITTKVASKTTTDGSSWGPETTTEEKKITLTVVGNVGDYISGTPTLNNNVTNAVVDAVVGTDVNVVLPTIKSGFESSATLTTELLEDGKSTGTVTGNKVTVKAGHEYQLVSHLTVKDGEKVIFKGDVTSNKLTTTAETETATAYEWDEIGNGTKGADNSLTYTYKKGDTYAPTIKKVKINNVEYTSDCFKISYEGNTAAGAAKVVLTFVDGAEKGKIVKIPFTIKAADLSKATVSLSNTYVYAPAGLQAESLKEAGLSVVLDGVTLKAVSSTETDANKIAEADVFYALTATEAGENKGIITISPKTGNNNYTSTAKLTFNVAQKDISTAFVVNPGDVAYIGEYIDPTMDGNNTNGGIYYTKDSATGKGKVLLTKGTDYSIDWNGTNFNKGTATGTVTGKGNYTGTTTVTFKINAAAATSLDGLKTAVETKLKATTGVTYDASNDVYKIEYTGKEQNVILPAYGLTWTLGTQYTYSYQGQHTNVGDFTVKVVGQNNYEGNSFTLKCRIVPKSINGFSVKSNLNKDGEITVKDLEYNGDYAEYKPDVTIAWNGMTLKEGIDYELANITVVGDKRSLTFDINGLGNYTGTKTFVTEKILGKNINASSITVDPIDNQTYTGSAISMKGKLTVKDGTKTLVEGKDYHIVTEKNNVKPGVATVTIAGQGNYSGEKDITFLIVNKEYNAVIVNKNGGQELPSKQYSYDKANSTKGITLETGEFKVLDNKGNVVPSNQYTVSYENNHAAGTATIKVTGKEGYNCSAISTFAIKPQTLNLGSALTLKEDTFVYTGEEIKPEYTVTLTDGSYKLVEGTDYEVKYSNNIDAANTSATDAPSVTLTGLGNYAGLNSSDKLPSETDKFTINKATLTASEVTANDVEYAGGFDVSDITVKNPVSGKVLTAGTDYTVTLENATKAGVAKAKIELTAAGKKNYKFGTGDSLAVRYNITAKDLKNVTVSAIADQAATGEQIKPAVTVMNGSVKLTEGKDYEVSYGENKEIGEGTVTIKALSSNKNYTGSQTVKFNIVKDAPVVGKTEISSVKVVGNKATVILSGDAEGASGYDYVISTDKDCTTSKDYDAISKNQVKTSTAFKYVQKGTYYAYCHAWTRDKNGKKVFGDWSEGYEFKVKATTPAAPVITEVKVKGSTITVTYNKVSNVAGYDVVLGTSSKNDNGELRPYRYGDHKILNINKNKVTVQFKNVPKKNWVVGMRSFTKDPDTNKKVFSRWSNLMPANMK